MCLTPKMTTGFKWSKHVRLRQVESMQSSAKCPCLLTSANAMSRFPESVAAQCNNSCTRTAGDGSRGFRRSASSRKFQVFSWADSTKDAKVSSKSSEGADLQIASSVCRVCYVYVKMNMFFPIKNTKIHPINVIACGAVD